MKRLVEVLGAMPHRFIVSKGPQHDLYDLAPNMVGAEFLPQPAILPVVDAVITHGGNNTFTECFHYGKPMIGLPLFWDQYDNAQRLDDAHYGARLPTYAFEPEQMELALDRVLHDAVLRQHMQVISQRLQANPGTERAADLIERVVA
jgi:UDP:flavonoid glycosyltransferase YjiC (YdhE family)